MSESGDYDPGPWRGVDMADARRHYDRHAGRSYERAVETRKADKDLIENSVSTDCKRPLLIALDQTGSMGEWPGVIAGKLPYLDKEGSEYLGEDKEICFMAFGDANSGRRDSHTRERYPLQVRPFAKGLAMKERIAELVLEGEGGGQVCETSDLVMLYCLHNVKTPHAKHKPILVLITDEKTYDTVSVDVAKHYAGVTEEAEIKTIDIVRLLQKKMAVYVVLKPYENNPKDGITSLNRQIFNKWADLLGEDHVSILSAPERVVDVIFGILATEMNRVDYFYEELTGRQTKAQVETVTQSLKTIHEGTLHKSRSGKSIVHGKGDGEKMKPLM